jgi:hypothetical protein
MDYFHYTRVISENAMTEPQGVIRTNISIPRDIKARMDKVMSPVNWSAVAVKAFEAKLLELDSEKEGDSMSDWIERMQAADKLDENEDYNAGRAAGTRWAKQKAHPRQLRNLQRSVDGSGGMEEGFSSVAHQAKIKVGPGVGWHVYFGMTGEKVVTTGERIASIAREADEFWREVLGNNKHRIESPFYGKGFVEGALGVWSMVKDHFPEPDPCLKSFKK